MESMAGKTNSSGGLGYRPNLVEDLEQCLKSKELRQRFLVVYRCSGKRHKHLVGYAYPVIHATVDEVPGHGWELRDEDLTGWDVDLRRANVVAGSRGDNLPVHDWLFCSCQIVAQFPQGLLNADHARMVAEDGVFYGSANMFAAPAQQFKDRWARPPEQLYPLHARILSLGSAACWQGDNLHFGQVGCKDVSHRFSRHEVVANMGEFEKCKARSQAIYL